MWFLGWNFYFAEHCCFIMCFCAFSRYTHLHTLSLLLSSSQSSASSVHPLPPINSHKRFLFLKNLYKTKWFFSRLNRQQSYPGTSQFKKRTRIPMSNSRYYRILSILFDYFLRYSGDRVFKKIQSLPLKVKLKKLRIVKSILSKGKFAGNLLKRTLIHSKMWAWRFKDSKNLSVNFVIWKYSHNLFVAFLNHCHYFG